MAGALQLFESGWRAMAYMSRPIIISSAVVEELLIAAIPFYIVAELSRTAGNDEAPTVLELSALRVAIDMAVHELGLDDDPRFVRLFGEKA